MQVQLVSHVIITSHSGVPSPIVELTQEVYDNTIDGEPIIEAEPVIHPGGSQDVDYQKVQTIGVASVVQAASAKVPDQEHPEKYLNHNHDLLLSVVEHNLWRKQTKQFKHHPEKHGDKLKVIPPLVQSKYHSAGVSQYCAGENKPINKTHF